MRTIDERTIYCVLHSIRGDHHAVIGFGVPGRPLEYADGGRPYDDRRWNPRLFDVTLQQYAYRHLSDSLGLGRLVPVDFAKTDVVL